MVVSLCVAAFAQLELGWMGRYRAQRALEIVTCGDNKVTIQIYAAPSTHGERLKGQAITHKDSRCSIAKNTCCFNADVLLPLYRQTWSWDGSVKSSHPPTAAVNTPQAEPGKTDDSPHTSSPYPKLLLPQSAAESRTHSTLSFAPLAESTASLDHQQCQGQRS